MGLYSLDDLKPRTAGEDCWVADNAVVVGDVEIQSDVSIWFNAAIRGDNEPIVIGRGTNIQEGCVLHVDPGFPMTIGPGCTIGHMVMLHGCTIGKGSLIGMGAILLNGCRIGRNCLIGAGTLITEGKQIPDNSVVLGAPGKIVRETTAADVEHLRRAAASYQTRWRQYAAGMRAVLPNPKPL